MNVDVLDATPGAVAPERRGWRRSRTSLISLAVSGALLAGLYRSVDMALVAEALRGARPFWLIVSLGMIAPITLVRALRFFWVAPAGALPGVAEAIRLTLVSSALNVFLPGKTGDLIKSYFIARRGRTPAGVALAIIVYERLCDVFGLVFWCVVGFAGGRPIATHVPPAVWLLLGGIGLACGALISSERVAGLMRALVAHALPHRRLARLRDLAGGWPDLLQILRGRRAGIVLLSCALWLAHLSQIWLFTVALSVSVPFTVCASLSALALIAGQVPFTLGGLGARDVALVILLAGYMTAEEAAAMGILISTRGFIPLLAALPFVRPYLADVVQEARRWRRTVDVRSGREATTAVGGDQRARP